MEDAEVPVDNEALIDEINKFLGQERDRLGISLPAGICASNSTVAKKFNGQEWWSKSAFGENKGQVHPGHYVAVIPSKVEGVSIVADISSSVGVLGYLDNTEEKNIRNQLNRLTDNNSPEEDWQLVRDYSIVDPEEEKRIQDILSKYTR